VSSTECQPCGAALSDGTVVCKDCLSKLGKDLISVSWLVRELEVALTRQSRFSRAQGARSATRPLPWEERAAVVERELATVIGMWAGVIRDLTTPAIGPERPLPAGTWRRALYLAGNLPRLRSHPEANTAHQQLTGVIRKARAVIDRPPDQVTYGLCGNDDPDETGRATRVPCDAYLYASPHEKRIIRCRKCGAEYSVEDRKAWMLEYVRGMAGTVTQVAGYLRLAGLKVSVDTVKGLRNRDRIFPLPGTDMFRFSEVIDAVSHRYQRKAKHH